MLTSRFSALVGLMCIAGLAQAEVRVQGPVEYLSLIHI